MAKPVSTYRGRPLLRAIEALQSAISFCLPFWFARPLIVALSSLALWVLRDVS